MGVHQPIFPLSVPSRQFYFQLFQREDPNTYCRVGEITKLNHSIYYENNILR